MVADVLDNYQEYLNSYIMETLQANSFTLVCKTK